MTDQTAAPAPVSNKKKGCAIVSTLLVLGGVVLCLGAIATPKYGGFNKCKPRQSEAKTNLSGLFTAQKAFYGEFNVYSTDLVAVNWWPDGSPRYVYGFAVPSTTNPEGFTGEHDPGRRTTIDSRVLDRKGFNDEKMQTLDGRRYTDADLQKFPQATATSSGFLAVAIGDVDADGEEALDVWTIDDKKNLVVLQNDCSS